MRRGIDSCYRRTSETIAGKNSNRPLVLNSRPPKKRKRILRFGFVFFKPSTLLIAAFYILSLGAITFAISHSLRATAGDDISTVDFYANAVRVTEGIEGAAGWTGMDKVMGQAEVTEAGAADTFSADNSALYAGGAQSLIVENFTTKEFIQTSFNETLPDTASSSVVSNVATTSAESSADDALPEEAATSTENISSSSIENIQDQVEATTPAPAESNIAPSLPSEENVPAATLPADEILPSVIETSPAVPSPEGENDVENPPVVYGHLPIAGPRTLDQAGDSSAPTADDSSSVPAPAELPLTIPSSGGEVSAPAEPSLAPSSPGEEIAPPAAPVSFLKGLKEVAALGRNLFGQIAKAQSLFGSEADDRNILFGAFKSAKIKISLASIKQAIEENSASSTEQTAAGSSPEDNAKIIIWYSFADEGDGNSWRELGTVGAENMDNASRGGYLAFEAPFLNDWRDLDNLRIKFEGQSAGNDFKAYLDSVWVEIAYQNGKAAEEKTPETQLEKDILNIDGRQIHFGYTDNNDNENLIIKTDTDKYVGLTSAMVYFSVENAGVRDEAVNFQYYFPNNSGSLGKIEKLVQNSPYLLSAPKFEVKIYDCVNGWDKRDDHWTCYPTGEERACDLVSPNRRYCRVEGVMTGTESKIIYQNRWEELGLNDNFILPQAGFFQRLLGLGAENKPVPKNFEVNKSTAAGEIIAPGEVRYFKATINFSPNTEGEFYIEAVGDGNGYGLLDPWWNSGWSYRLPVTVNNSGNASPLAEYPVYLEISSSTSRDFWRNVRSDGGDIRFANSNETVELPYWIQYFNGVASSAKIWVQVDSAAAGTSSKIFLYYGKPTATTTSSQYAPFTYSSLQPLYYTASSSANSTLNIISLIDNNQVQLDGQAAVNLNRQQITIITGYNATSTINAKGPIMAKFSTTAAAESVIPISFAATSFVIPSSLSTETFHVYSPFANATTTIRDGTVLEKTQLVNQGKAWTVANDIAVDSIAIVEATKPVLLSFIDSAPGDSLIGYPATNRDLYGIKSQFNLIGASAASSFSIFCSSNSSTTVSAMARGALLPNQICAGDAEGVGNAVRIGKISGAINAILQNDSDGNESAMFWPFQEFSTEYMIPTNAAHIAIACAPESGLVNLSIYSSSNIFVASTTCRGSGIYPGKAYFGAIDATTYTAGARIVSTNGQPFYAYYEDTSAAGATGGDETNLIGAVQGRKLAYPDPALTFGAQEIQGPPTGLINSANESNDRSGRVNISITAADVSNDNSRAKIEYVAQTGGHCDFASPLKPALDESAISATYGAPVIQNKNAYQVGTTTGWILTSSGANTVNFNWLSKSDLPTGDGVYCLRLTVNDNLSDQAVLATTTVTIDNVAPTVPGTLTAASRTGASVTFAFAATSSDTHFKQYKIYYKQYDGTPVIEAGTLFGSSSDANLAAANLNKATSTTIFGLTAGLKYTFNIFAYDTFGNRASSTSGVDIIANDPPTASFNSAVEKTDGSGRVDISFTASDLNLDNTLRAKLEYEAGSACAFSSPSLAAIDTNNITATFGTVSVDNSENYRLGTTSNFILSSLGANTVSFGWWAKDDLPLATSTFCLRLTLNDGVDDQSTPAKMVVVVDNVKPDASGNLAKGSTTQTSIQLLLPITQTARDTNEPLANAYKVFYKAGTSGVRETDSEFDSLAFDTYGFNGSSSVIVSGLTASTSYVFNIWAYDTFGNTASATEIMIKTDSQLTNKSLGFINPQSSSSTLTNVALADGLSPWNFRAVVSDVGGYALINDITLRLADSPDNSSPYNDLEFKWTQSGNSFSEIGADVNNAAAISGDSSSVCAGLSCVIDFKIIFAKTFATSSVNYSGELYSTDSAARTDDDIYSNIFQIRKTWLDQNHYRWRNDNGGG